MNLTRKLAASLVVGLLAWCPFLLAQDKPKAETRPVDLDKLLEKLESRPVGPVDDPKAKPQAQEKEKPKAKPTPAKDKDLDDLLEKLGKTEEAPTTTGKAAPKPDPDHKPKADDDASKGRRDPLTGEAAKLDERLAELMGRKKKKPQEEQQDDGGDSMLAEAIKKMREVEQRLQQPDTGEATRKKQEEIVQELNQIIKQAQQRQQQKKKMMAQRKQQGGQEQQGDQPGNEAGQAPWGADKPTGEHSLVGDKGAWGHLPATLREEMANIFKEGYLPAQAELIKRYYMSVNKKALARGD